MHKVLIVDDEQMVLDSIIRALHKEPYTVEMTDNGEDALKIIKRSFPSVIIADMCMPHMDGHEFLSKAQLICPDSIYLVLSAYSDINNIMKAVNEQHVWRYITKPWEKEELRLAIQNALEMFEHRKIKNDLISALKTKNKQLVELNEILEHKVRERTLALQNENEILQMLVKDFDIGLILQKICSSISLHLHISPVFIDVPFLSKTFSDTSQSPTVHLSDLSNTAMHEMRDIMDKNALAVPLTEDGTVLGTILISKIQEHCEFKLADSKFSFVSTAILCLMQAWNLRQVDQMMDELK